MIENLRTLQQIFKKQGFSLESKLLWFLLKYAGYEEEWRQIVEDKAIQNPKPFNKWFDGQDRLYFPFKTKRTEDVPIDDEVLDAIEQAGYEITDYINGICQKDGRIYRIGKIIEKLRQEEIKKSRLANEKLGNDPKVYLDLIQQKWNDINNLFLNSPYRRNKKYQDSLEIVISQNPHDLAKMSYERAWTSCMELGEGEKHQNVFCEIEEGGFVAYLITSDDKEIEKPLARIHIRRFLGQNGINLAKPEKEVYGNDMPGFSEFVEAWVAKKNQETFGETSPIGFYKRKGGEWSDTFTDIYIITPETKEGLINWFQETELPKKTTESVWEVEDLYYDTLNGFRYWDDYKDSLPEEYEGIKRFENRADAEEFQQYINYLDSEDSWMDLLMNYEEKERFEEDGVLDEEIDRLRDDRFSIKEITTDYKDSLKLEAANKLVDYHAHEIGPDLAESILKYFKSRTRSSDQDFARLSEIYLNYPDLLNEEEFRSFGLKSQSKLMNNFSTDNPEKADELYREFKKNVQNVFVIDNPFFKSSPPRFSYNYPPSSKDVAGGMADNISTTMRQIYDANLDDELYSIIKKFLFEDLYKNERLTKSEEAIESIYRSALRGFKPENMTISSAIDFASKLLPVIDLTNWEVDHSADKVSIHDWLYFVKELKSAGSIFLPTIYRFGETLERDVENNENFQRIIREFGDNGVIYDNKMKQKNDEIIKRKERINYTIDCIENDLSYSKKFNWFIL